MTISPRKFTGFSPRRSIIPPTLCTLLLITVWSLGVPHPSFQWLGHRPEGPTNRPPSYPPTNIPSGPGPYPIDIDLADPEAPFVGWPLERVCNEAKRVEGLVFVCDNNSGGLGNIRNYIQTCLRYALEAGATGITLPRIRQRDDTDLANIWTDYLPFTYMFDEGHFRAAFGRHCPHIRIYDNATAIPGVGEKEREIELITPKDFGDREECHPWDQNRNFQRFGDRFRAWLQIGTDRPPPSANHTRTIRFHWGVLWDWQVWYDGPEFATTFGSVLRFNEQLLRLGNKVFENMREFACEQQRQQRVGGGSGSGGSATEKATGAFIGVHLRTESDAMDDWPTYLEQFDTFRRQAILEGSNKGGSEGQGENDNNYFGAAYLATGDAAEAEKFVRAAATELSNMKVVGKRDLLEGEDLAELNSLTFDQQGIVDAVVLLASDFFVGTMPSSFSVYIAMKRHLRTGGLYTRPWKVGATEGDGLSHMGGHYRKYWENWLFMWDGMWP